MRSLLGVRAATLALAFVVMGGVGHAQTAPQPPGVPLSATTPTKLAGLPVYIYSFLDLRFPPQVLDQIDHQLQAAFAASNVTTEVLRFEDSSVAASFAQAASHPIYGRSQTSESIPVEQTIASNQDAERRLGARYRLLAFPSKFFISGGARAYQIRWTLMDCATNRVVWVYVYEGRNIIWFSNNERAESRANQLVDPLMAQLKSSGWL